MRAYMHLSTYTTDNTTWYNRAQEKEVGSRLRNPELELQSCPLTPASYLP